MNRSFFLGGTVPGKHRVHKPELTPHSSRMQRTNRSCKKIHPGKTERRWSTRLSRWMIFQKNIQTETTVLFQEGAAVPPEMIDEKDSEHSCNFIFQDIFVALVSFMNTCQSLFLISAINSFFFNH